MKTNSDKHGLHRNFHELVVVCLILTSNLLVIFLQIDQSVDYYSFDLLHLAVIRVDYYSLDLTDLTIIPVDYYSFDLVDLTCISYSPGRRKIPARNPQEDEESDSSWDDKWLDETESLLRGPSVGV